MVAGVKERETNLYKRIGSYTVFFWEGRNQPYTVWWENSVVKFCRTEEEVDKVISSRSHW
jgi:regulatory protein YycH of two-component signal transduction system YycFG